MKQCSFMGAEQVKRIRNCHKKEDCPDKMNFGNGFLCKRPLQEERCRDSLQATVGGQRTVICMATGKCSGQGKKKDSRIVECLNPQGVPIQG